jgi:hypothetical protein
MILELVEALPAIIVLLSFLGAAKADRTMRGKI